MFKLNIKIQLSDTTNCLKLAPDIQYKATLTIEQKKQQLEMSSENIIYIQPFPTPAIILSIITACDAIFKNIEFSQHNLPKAPYKISHTLEDFNI